MTRGTAAKEYLHRIFPLELARHEYDRERFIPIPEEILEIYSTWRPTPLVRAKRLERVLNTPARIYYKNEAVSPPGSHKANAAIAQAYYAKSQGIKRLVTSTTAGQWGSALAFACTFFDLECTVYMPRVNCQQKPYRKNLIESWGGQVHPSPSEHTDIGRKMISEDPNNMGTMATAKSEALDDVLSHDDSRNAVGSIMNFVLATQTVIGEEAKTQLAEDYNDYPDLVVGCVGGGSNFSGIAWPFFRDMVEKKTEMDFLGVESTAAPRLTMGEYLYDHADTSRRSPLFKMYTIGHSFVPPPIHTGGLRVHGSAPSLSIMVKEGIVRPIAYNQVEVFEAASLFSRTEGILTAPETAHAIRGVIDEAKKCKESGEKKVILFNHCGHGLLDLESYVEYNAGRIQENNADPIKVRQAIQQIKDLYPWINK